MDIKIRLLADRPETLITYAVLGTVFSGDCDTTLMNTVRMALYNLYTNDRNGLIYEYHYIAWSKGDDFTVMYQNEVDIEYAQRGYRKYWLAKAKPNDPSFADVYDNRTFGLGQILKMLDFGGPDSFEFCSLNAWYTNYITGHITLTRDLKKLTKLANYSRKTKIMNNIEVYQYIVDQVVALQASYKGIQYIDKYCYLLMERAKEFLYACDYNMIQKAQKKRRTCGDTRVTYTLLGATYMFYNTTPRHTVNKIKHGATYWETMKEIYNKKEMRLNPAELELVNQQINEKFPANDLCVL